MGSWFSSEDIDVLSNANPRSSISTKANLISRGIIFVTYMERLQELYENMAGNREQERVIANTLALGGLTMRCRAQLLLQLASLQSNVLETIHVQVDNINQLMANAMLDTAEEVGEVLRLVIVNIDLTEIKQRFREVTVENIEEILDDGPVGNDKEVEVSAVVSQWLSPGELEQVREELESIAPLPTDQWLLTEGSGLDFSAGVSDSSISQVESKSEQELLIQHVGNQINPV